MTIAIAAVLFVVAAVVLVASLRPARQAAEPTPDGYYLSRAAVAAPPGQERGFVDRVIVPAFSVFGRRLYRVLPPGRIGIIRRKIQLAGRQANWNVEKVLAMKVLGVGVAALAGFAMLNVLSGMLGVIFCGLLLVCGYFASDFILDKAAAARQLEIRRSLADMLDQLTVCVEAGLGFDAAMQRCIANNNNALADELGRALQDIRLGVPRSTALNQILERTDVPELRLLVRAIHQADKSGVPLARILRVQADEVREKRRQAAEERAMKLPVLLIVPLVLCILPSLFIVIMGPAVIRMMQEGAV